MQIVDTFPVVIAGCEFKSMEDILDFTPNIDNYSGEAGNRKDEFLAFLRTSCGKSFPVDFGGIDINYANCVSDTYYTGHSIRQSITALKESVVAIKLTYEYTCSYDDSEDIHEAVMVPIAPIDWPTVRRRVEDRIRKDDQAVKDVAGLLGIKLY